MMLYNMYNFLFFYGAFLTFGWIPKQYGLKFNPTIKDAKNTEGLSIPKSNWANKIDTPPFEAYGVTCGITFTFGGLRINSKAQVLDNTMKPIPGLFAAGETAGGIFYFNYPGGSGLMSGAVFGKIAGKNAVKTN